MEIRLSGEQENSVTAISRHKELKEAVQVGLDQITRGECTPLDIHGLVLEEIAKYQAECRVISTKSIG